VRELSRNSFCDETNEEFQLFIEYLKQLAAFGDYLSRNCPLGGRSDKLLALEELLEDQIESNSGDALKSSCVVFVQCRVTALALHNFFQFRQEELDKNNWNRASETRKMYSNDSGLLSVLQSERNSFSSPFVDASSNTVSIGRHAVGSNAAASMASKYHDADDDDDDDEKLLQGYLANVREGAVDNQNRAKPDQFAEDMDADSSVHENFESLFTAQELSAPHDQFNDVDESTDEEIDLSPSKDADLKEESICGKTTRARRRNLNSIRCRSLVRHPTRIFMSLNIARRPRRLDSEEEYHLRKNWLHSEEKVRDVLGQLRRGEINVLIATSIIEEGVDVQACSCVVAFDSLQSTKGYIQMKGRARQKYARFFVFKDTLTVKSQLSLEAAQGIIQRVNRLLACRSSLSSVIEQVREHKPKLPAAEFDCDEMRAVAEGIYRTNSGIVELTTAKSLVNRYISSLPVDPICRTSKSSFLAYLPTYSAVQGELTLPSHIPPDLRKISLPKEYADVSKKEKIQILALMACVRLHRAGLLNDRLLPLTRSDLHERMLCKVILNKLKISVRFLSNTGGLGETTRTFFVYPIKQKNDKIKKLHNILNGKGQSLAIMSTKILPDIPSMKVLHQGFGTVECCLGEIVPVEISEMNFQIISRFTEALFGARWRRRSKRVFFRSKDLCELSSLVHHTFVCALGESGELNFTQMAKLFAESKRSKAERIEAVRNDSDCEDLPAPRLYSPLYDRHFIYVVYGPSGETCDAPFPNVQLEGVKTYHDYFAKFRNYPVNKDSPLLDAQRLWTLPFNKADAAGDEDDCNFQPQNSAPCKHSEKYEVFEELRSLKLPKDACLEVPMADPNMLLLSKFKVFAVCFLTISSIVTHVNVSFPMQVPSSRSLCTICNRI